jgi:hypothetical protein
MGVHFSIIATTCLQQLKDKLTAADAKAIEAEQELAISRRQLERLQDAHRAGFGVSSKSDDDNSSQLRVKVQPRARLWSY